MRDPVRLTRPARRRAAGRVARIAATTAILCATAGATAPTEAGWQAYEAGQYQEAVAIWKRAAAKGKPVAQYGLGLAYDIGRGVAPDPIAACAWYRRAGEAGHATAAFSAGQMYENGRCGPRDAAQAARWYGRAAAAGMARAQFNLAQLYANGDGVPRNPEQASAWYRLAAANGIDAAASRIAKPPPVNGPVTAPLIPAEIDSPDGQQPVPAGDGSIPLVWAAPDEPESVRFYVELTQVLDSGPQDVIGRYVDVSAVLMQLPQNTGRFAWRVLTVGTDSQRYVVGAWRQFTVTSTEPS